MLNGKSNRAKEGESIGDKLYFIRTYGYMYGAPQTKPLSQNQVAVYMGFTDFQKVCKIETNAALRSSLTLDRLDKLCTLFDVDPAFFVCPHITIDMYKKGLVRKYSELKEDYTNKLKESETPKTDE